MIHDKFINTEAEETNDMWMITLNHLSQWWMWETQTNKKIQTMSTKCQYQIAHSKPTWWEREKW